MLSSEILEDADRAVGHQQIQPAIVVIIEPQSPETGVASGLQSVTRLVCSVFEKTVSLIHVKSIGFLHQMSDEDIIITISVEISGVYSHAGLRLPVAINCHASEQCFVPEGAVFLIYPELIWIAVVRNVKVRPSVPVEIGGDNSKASPKFLADSRPAGYIFKNAIALVVKQSIPSRPKRSRHTVITFAGIGVAVRTAGCREGYIVHHKKIQPAVSIVVEERRARAPARVVGEARLGDVRKRAVAIVNEHLIRAEIANVQIVPSIVVNITNRDAHYVAGRENAALLRHIR